VKFHKKVIKIMKKRESKKEMSNKEWFFPEKVMNKTVIQIENKIVDDGSKGRRRKK
jgi:hypothetical protein